MKEKNLLTESAQKLIQLLETPGSDRTEIKRETLEISNRISNIAGFCDNQTRLWAARVTTLLGILMIPGSEKEHKYLMIDLYIKPILPRLVAVQVDFVKDKFRIINFGFSIRELEAKIKAVR